jgi:hypothetical protein
MGEKNTGYDTGAYGFIKDYTQQQEEGTQFTPFQIATNYLQGRPRREIVRIARESKAAQLGKYSEIRPDESLLSILYFAATTLLSKKK